MSVPLSYLGVILIWATTPLAIKWSGEGPGFLFGVASRMTVGALLALALMPLLGVPLRRDRAARHTYLAVGVPLYVSMVCVYWAAQQIPSGWISVVFGVTPILTGLLANYWLGECALTPPRVAGMLAGLGGLALMFAGGLGLSAGSVGGVAVVLLASLLHALSSVAVKRLDARLPALATVAGGLVVAVPLYLATWALFDGHWPAHLPAPAVGAILYLAVVGSVLGFVLYYYVLRHVEATRVALITLVTPVCALLLGHFFNGETLDAQVWAGTGLIVGGLALFELGGRRVVPAPG